jgi:hypothetical protein
MAAAGLEAHLNLVLLDMQSVDGLIDSAPGPEEGFVLPPVRAHRQQKITVKRGRDRHGAPLDETVVSISPDAEIDAQIATLA